jgi:Flp pilus assembly pilin Flp
MLTGAAQIREDRGQDLIEYTLLLAFVALVVAALFAGSGASIQGLWSTANSTIVTASAPASGGASAPAGGGSGSGSGSGGGGDGDHDGH